MAELVKVAKLSDIKEGEVKSVMIGSEKVAIYRKGERIFATSDICTHADCIISENSNLEGDEVECTCHGSKFNIKTGEVTSPPATEPLKTYQVNVEGEDVFIEV
jgi:3-phenylpropionate/trans-cinnamate dioxygenase ferredoxin subunit